MSCLCHWIHCQRHVQHWPRQTFHSCCAGLAPWIALDAVFSGVRFPDMSVEDVDVILCGRLKLIGAKHNCVELVAVIGALDWHHHKKPWSLEHCNV